MLIPLSKGRGKGSVKVIEVEGEKEKENEIIVRHEVASSKWKTWNHDASSRDWKKNYSV